MAQISVQPETGSASNLDNISLSFSICKMIIIFKRVAVIIRINLPGSSVRGIFQARTLEWVAIPFFRGSSQPGDWTQVTCIAGRFFYHLSHWRSPILVTALSTKLMLLYLNIKLRSISDALGIPATLHIILCLWMLSNICIRWPSSVNHF